MHLMYGSTMKQASCQFTMVYYLVYIQSMLK